MELPKLSNPILEYLVNRELEMLKKVVDDPSLKKEIEDALQPKVDQGQVPDSEIQR